MRCELQVFVWYIDRLEVESSGVFVHGQMDESKSTARCRWEGGGVKQDIRGCRCLCRILYRAVGTVAIPRAEQEKSVNWFCVVEKVGYVECQAHALQRKNCEPDEVNGESS